MNVASRRLLADAASAATVRVDEVSGEVILVSATEEPVASPTEALGLSKPDPLADRVARLYAKGLLVSVDKLTRIPPLDAPLDPSIFGDPSEMQRGNVTRKVSMRVSVIDEKTLEGYRPTSAGSTNLAGQVHVRPCGQHAVDAIDGSPSCSKRS